MGPSIRHYCIAAVCTATMLAGVAEGQMPGRVPARGNVIVEPTYGSTTGPESPNRAVQARRALEGSEITETPSRLSRATAIRRDEKADAQLSAATAATAATAARFVSRRAGGDDAERGEAAGNEESPQRPPMPKIVPTSAVGYILRQADAAVCEAELLLGRKSIFAARQAAEKALGHLAEANDRVLPTAKLNSGSHVDELERALVAIRESGDFWGRLGPLHDEDLPRRVAAHRTEVLKATSLERLAARDAADIYLDFARESLVRGLGKGPMACRALAVLAGAYRVQAAESPQMADNYEMIAVCCLRAATTCDSANAGVANELGYLLLRRELLQEARWALFRSLSAQPTPQALQNLAEVHRRFGHLDLALQCIDAAGRLHPQQPAEAGVQLVSPEELARFGSGMAPAVPHARAAAPAAATAVPATSADAANWAEPARVAKTPWYQQLLR